MVSVPCKMCSGDGKVKREMPSKVPLCRLEGGATVPPHQCVYPRTFHSPLLLARAHLEATLPPSLSLSLPLSPSLSVSIPLPHSRLDATLLLSPYLPFSPSPSLSRSDDRPLTQILNQMLDTCYKLQPCIPNPLHLHMLQATMLRRIWGSGFLSKP